MFLDRRQDGVKVACNKVRWTKIRDVILLDLEEMIGPSIHRYSADRWKMRMTPLIPYFVWDKL